MGEIRNEYKILTGNLEGKSPLKPTRTRNDNIKLGVREKGWEDVM